MNFKPFIVTFAIIGIMLAMAMFTQAKGLVLGSPSTSGMVLGCKDPIICLLQGNNNWSGINIFQNIVIINYTSLNVTGQVNASSFCYMNGTCIDNFHGFATISSNNTFILVNNDSGVTAVVYPNISAFDDRYANANIQYFLYNTSSTDVTSYLIMNTSASTGSRKNFTNTTITNGQLLKTWINSNTNLTLLKTGIVVYHAHFLKNSGTKDLQVTFQLYKRNSSGEFFITDSELSDFFNIGTESEQELHGTVPQSLNLNVSDKLVLRLYANVSGSGSDPSLTTIIEGDTAAGLSFNTNTNSINLNEVDPVAIHNGSAANLSFLSLQNLTLYLNNSYNNTCIPWVNRSVLQCLNTTSNSIQVPYILNGLQGARVGLTLVNEQAMTLSDVVTWDVSTGGHGFAPKATGNVSQFLNANGSYSTPNVTIAEVDPVAIHNGSDANLSKLNMTDKLSVKAQYNIQTCAGGIINAQKSDGGCLFKIDDATGAQTGAQIGRVNVFSNTTNFNNAGVFAYNDIWFSTIDKTIVQLYAFKNTTDNSGIFSIVLRNNGSQSFPPTNTQNFNLSIKGLTVSAVSSVNSSSNESVSADYNATISFTLNNTPLFTWYYAADNYTIVNGSQISLNTSSLDQRYNQSANITINDSLLPGLPPIGGIIMYAGDPVSLNSCWVVCNGSNDTPDLRDRFVMSVSDNNAINTTGGSSTHYHSSSTDSSTTGIYDGGHSHGATLTSGAPSILDPFDSISQNVPGVSINAVYTVSGTTDTDYASLNDGGHSHTFTTDTVSNIPPYYALYYIERIC